MGCALKLSSRATPHHWTNRWTLCWQFSPVVIPLVRRLTFEASPLPLCLRSGFPQTGIFTRGRWLLPGVVILVGRPAFQGGPAQGCRWPSVTSWLKRTQERLSWWRLEILTGSGLTLELWPGVPVAVATPLLQLLTLLHALLLQLEQVMCVVYIVVLRTTLERPLLHTAVMEQWCPPHVHISQMQEALPLGERALARMSPGVCGLRRLLGT